MNEFTATISEVKTDGCLSLVSLSAEGLTFTCIVVDTPETDPFLKAGKRVKLLFKETEVVLGLQPDPLISLRNRLPGKVTSVEKSPLLSQVKITTAIGSVSSIITTQSCESLQLKPGSEVTAFIKTNEIMLSHEF